MRKLIMVGVAGVVALSGSAGAQFLTPPSADPGELTTPPYIPPQPPEKLVRDMARRNAEKAKQALAEEEAKRQAQNLPEMEYESLVTHDDAGKLVRLEEDPDLAALRRNPMVPDEARELALAVARERQARFDELVVRNLELVEELDGGALDSLNVFDRGALNELRQRLKVFQSESRLTSELVTREVLTPIQGRFNTQMVQEYDQALKGEDLGERPGPDVMMKFLLRQGLRETFGTYEALLRTAGENGNLVAAELGLPAKIGTAATSAGKDAAKVKDVLAGLSLEERQSVMELARDIRASDQ